MNNNTKKFLAHLCKFLPERKPVKRGPKPISAIVMLIELQRLFKTSCGWRGIKHQTTCRRYLYEIQRRGLLKKFHKFITSNLTIRRLGKVIIDSSDRVSYRTCNLVTYSGKYHNYCIKITIAITEDCVPIYYSVDVGSAPDSEILDKMLIGIKKLPYELFLDKGYERYQRRQELKKQNCQVRMEMKNCSNNRKLGPRFKFTHEHKYTRGLIEKVVAWLKSYSAIDFNKFRKRSVISASFLFCLSAITFNRLLNL